ncbi:hypothetical protein ABIB27_001488 [Arthrobacter sp. UYEF21]
MNGRSAYFEDDVSWADFSMGTLATREELCRIPYDCATVVGKGRGQGLECNTESLIRLAGIKKCKGEKGTMCVPGDVVFLHILENFNRGLELAHIVQ